jgi:hypothetical protein
MMGSSRRDALMMVYERACVNKKKKAACTILTVTAGKSIGKKKMGSSFRLSLQVNLVVFVIDGHFEIGQETHAEESVEIGVVIGFMHEKRSDIFLNGSADVNFFDEQFFCVSHTGRRDDLSLSPIIRKILVESFQESRVDFYGRRTRIDEHLGRDVIVDHDIDQHTLTNGFEGDDEFLGGVRGGGRLAQGFDLYGFPLLGRRDRRGIRVMGHAVFIDPSVEVSSHRGGRLAEKKEGSP